MWAAGTMPMCKEKGSGGVSRAITPNIAAMAGCTFSYPGLRGIPFIRLLEEGGSNTHTRSFTEHTQIPPSKVSWAPTGIHKGYADLEITKETRNLAPLPVSRHCLHIRKGQMQVVFDSSLDSFTMVSPNTLTSTTSFRRNRNSISPRSYLGRRYFYCRARCYHGL